MPKTMDRWLEELALDEDPPALDEDVLFGIFNKCSLRDCVRMGAVCKSWLKVSKWSLRTRSQLPWLMMLSDPIKYKNQRRPRPVPWKNPNFRSSVDQETEQSRCFFGLSHDAIKGTFTFQEKGTFTFQEMSRRCCCGSFYNGDARGWLMTIDNENLDMQLFHPWRRIQLQLPHHSTLQSPYPPFGYNSPFVNVKIRKAAMSDDASVVAVIHDQMVFAFWRRGDKVWTTVRNSVNADDVSDVIYHKGRFYVVTWDGILGVIHINGTTHPYIEPLTEKVQLYGYQRRIYLVADSIGESLFIVVRISRAVKRILDKPNDIRRTLSFKIYETVLEETGQYTKKPVEVESLGDRVFFLGQNSSMLVIASEYPGLKGNCIYFTDDYLEAHLYESPRGIGCVDLGVFNMEDRTIKPLFRDRLHPTFSPPVWIAPP